MTHSSLIIRKIRNQETSFLEEMLYEAIFTPAGMEKPGKEIIALPELSRYITDFGRKGDICLIAEIRGELIGAVWTRLFPPDDRGYGYIDEDTPELSMAVAAAHRKSGIGKILLTAIVHELSLHGFHQVSLSVDKRNFAFDFYRKSGFEVHQSVEHSAIMFRKLNKI